MRIKFCSFSCLLTFISFCTCCHAKEISPKEKIISSKEMLQTIKKLHPLHKIKNEPPAAGEWLACHDEKGQTFKQYLSCEPSLPTSERKIIYIQPLGKFTTKQKRVVACCAKYIQLFYNLPVVVKKPLDLNVIPEQARRVHPSWGDEQINSKYVLHKVLRPRLPEDAMAYIAFTTSDLYPRDDWNFVFGQASLKHRVGVWSIYRNGDPEESKEMFKTCLKRTIKTAIHEIGHMFTIKHCIKYDCCMNGSNSREESDEHPLYFCPECAPKVSWATKTPLLTRFPSLAECCEKYGFDSEAEFYRKSINSLSSPE